MIMRYGVRLKKAREVGSYQLVELIGSGGMGEVWIAWHQMLARPAAIKLIRADILGADPRSREIATKRFEREAQATAALGSSHTVDVYDFGVSDDGGFFYVMELLDGLNLEGLVNRYGPIEPSRAIFLLRQVCHSLAEAHEHGLIHRDVKPANIFACHLGPDYDFVKVLDFGLVKGDAALLSRGELTTEGLMSGTPAYMAPEMALSEPRVDGRADIYALGCVAYFLLTGQQVFTADSSLATLLKHVREEPVPPSDRTRHPIPPALDALVLSCLAKTPDERPQSAETLSAMLLDVDSAIDPADRWTPARARQWWERHQPRRISA
jgi:serine/threonine-protein kinase